MAITKETAEQHKLDSAVVCCRVEAGTVIAPENLEDPAIFPDLVDSGLLTIPENCLKIGEVLGAKLTETIDSLTPITTEIVESCKSIESTEAVEEVEEAEEVLVTQATEIPNVNYFTGNVGKIKIHIGEGKDIYLEF